MTVFRCRECGTVHDTFQALADCCDPLTGGDDDPGSAPPLVADGGLLACEECGDAVPAEAFKVVGGRLFHFECAPDDPEGVTFEHIEIATDGGVPVDEALAGAGFDAGEVLDLVVDDDGLHFVRDVGSWNEDDGLRADGGTRSRRAERATDRGQSSLQEHVREGDTLAGVGDQDDDECPNGEAWCPSPAAVRDDELPCFECFLEAGDDDVDRGDGAVTDGGVDLPTGAHRVDPLAARDAESTAFERARDERTSVEPIERGRFRVRVGDGDVHDVALVEDQESHVGHCDCDGFTFHTGGGDGDAIPGGVCAHLCAVAMDDALNDVVPTVDGHAVDPLVGDVDAEVVTHGPAGDQEAGDDQDDAEPTTVEHVESDVDDAREERESTTTATPARATPARPTVDEDAPDDLDEFVTDVAGVPSVFVVDMGRGSSSKPYVTKEGLTYIARKAGIQVSAEPLSPTWEGDADVAAYRGVAVDDDGRRYEDVATAHAGKVESTVGRENLDELASTRATNRALWLATGCGFASVEELDADAAITPGTDAEVVDDPELATDGGRR